MNWEEWLRTAASRPSDHEDSRRDRTEQQIRNALSAYGPLTGRPYRVYVKGSYANNTNVRLNFDVDIAVEYHGYFYSELVLDLAGHDKSELGLIDSSDPYTRAEFKADVLAAMNAAFGSRAVTAGRIAYRIREGKTTLPADVVPCWEYRRYDRISPSGEQVVHYGSRVYPSDGSFINNFPKIQVSKGTSKNLSTSRRYKRMVRCLKKLQTLMVAENALDEELPSYLIECIVYNVPDTHFNHNTYLADMRAVLAFVFNATRASGGAEEWVEVHGLSYLFRGQRSWSISQAHHLASVAWDYMGLE